MSIFDQTSIINALKSVLPFDGMPIGLHEPSFGGNEKAYLNECIDTGWVSSAGKFVDRFERELAEFVGVKQVVAVVNGTAALHVCLKLVGVGPGDEVLVPTLTFVATGNAVSYCGATPHFVDSENSTLGLSPSKLSEYLKEIAEVRGSVCFNKKTGRPIKAVVPMHTFGHPVDIDPLLEICSHFRIELIEDAAESLGSYYKNKHTGNWGRLSALSFNGNKIITTGGGGAILTNDESLAKLAKHITTTARVPHKWSFYHDQVGFNYRLPNINAALGCAQLEQLPRFITRKRMLAERYRNAFSGVSGVRFFAEPCFAKSNYWLNVLLLDNQFAGRRDALLEKSNSLGIATRPVWTPLHKLAMYKSCPRMVNLDSAEDIERRLINIPSSASLSSADAQA